LLDHLAARFMREGWSIKKMVRTLVLTRAYQLSSETQKAGKDADPANRLIWRHSPRRLSAEEIRDATLAATGMLDRSRPIGSPAMDFKVTELRNNGPEAKKLIEHANANQHRSVYLPLVRGITPTSLEVFDLAEQGMVAGSRDSTTVAPQALYLLNDPFVLRQSRSLAGQLLARTDIDDGGRIGIAHRLTLGRPATVREVERIKAYLVEYESAARDLMKSDPKTAAWSSLCQALFASAEFRYLR
jgi:hypothetical protein